MPAPDPGGGDRQRDRRRGLLSIGLAAHPDTGHDHVMVVSTDGHGLFDAFTGEKTARDRDPDVDVISPE